MGVSRRRVVALRWVARLWSLMLLVVGILMFVVPESDGGETAIALSEAVVLGFWGISVIGLLLAWWKEVLGALIAVAGVILHYLGFRVIVGEWAPVMTVVIAGILFVLPAVLYLLASLFDRIPSRSVGV